MTDQMRYFNVLLRSSKDNHEEKREHQKEKDYGLVEWQTLESKKTHDDGDMVQYSKVMLSK